MKSSSTKSTPFMMKVQGNIEVFDNDTGHRIPGFVGLCTSDSVTEFWRLYTSRNERAFTRLYSRNLRDAKIESRYFRIIHRIMSHHDMVFADAMTILFLRTSSEGKWCGQVIREAFADRHRKLRLINLSAA